MRLSTCLALLALGLGPLAGARAEVVAPAGDGFAIAFSTPIAVPPAKAWAALVQPQRWWNDEHTWSGDAGNLSLLPSAGGCFCERWDEGSAEHARVLMVLPERLLRLSGALGPLQELGVAGTLSFWLRYAEDGSARLDTEYRVSGSASLGLDQWADSVEGMLQEQASRLQRLLETGKAEPEPAGDDEPAPHAGIEREALLEAWRREAEAALGKPGAGAPPPARGKPDGR